MALINHARSDNANTTCNEDSQRVEKEREVGVESGIVIHIEATLNPIREGS